MCKIKPSQINVKAKTTDKLGLIGKNKALACSNSNCKICKNLITILLLYLG